MPLADWIDRYPQVKALLQADDDALLYGVEDPTPETQGAAQDFLDAALYVFQTRVEADTAQEVRGERDA